MMFLVIAKKNFNSLFFIVSFLLCGQSHEWLFYIFNQSYHVREKRYTTLNLNNMQFTQKERDRAIFYMCDLSTPLTHFMIQLPPHPNNSMIFAILMRMNFASACT